jgi:hypothetical protein
MHDAHLPTPPVDSLEVGGEPNTRAYYIACTIYLVVGVASNKKTHTTATHLPTPPVDSVVVGGEPPWLVVVCVVPPTLPELNEDAPGPDV